MRWWLYNVLFTTGYLLLMPSYLLRMRKRGGYRAHFAQRFGRYEPGVREALQSRRRIWIHAVSVGEAYVAVRLIEELRRLKPEIALLVSTTSSTGYGVFQASLAADDVLLYFPMDFPGAVRRALDAVRPSALVLTESEIWPNMVRACVRRSIPVMLVNGRISDRSFPRYRALRFFFKPVLRCFRGLLVQFEEDRRRLLTIGAEPQTVRVMGTVKFDVAPPAADAAAKARKGLRAAGIPEDATVLLGASTWPGEEAALLRVFKTLRKRHPNLRLVLVPRHMERGNEVETAIVQAGLACVRRSRHLREHPAGDGAVAGARDAVLLADTTGELFAFCSLADLVFVGKTLSPNVGGQNMIEPAALGKAVAVGPHTENFAGVMTILRNADAVREIPDEDGLARVFGEWLDQPELRVAFGCRAAEAVAAQAGALSRSARAVLELCG